jgi:hypothetical protein
VGHEDIGGDPLAASRRDGPHVQADAGPAYDEHLCVGSLSKYRIRNLLRHLNDTSLKGPLATCVAPSAT